MEAYGSAHWRGRGIKEFVHEVLLVPPICVNPFFVLIGIAGFAVGCLMVSLGFKLEFGAETINQQMAGLLYLIAGLVSLLVAVCAFGVVSIVRSNRSGKGS